MLVQYPEIYDGINGCSANTQGSGSHLQSQNVSLDKNSGM